MDFYTVRGGTDSVDHRSRRRLVGVVIFGSIHGPGIGPYPARVWLAPRAAANQRSARGVAVFTPCRMVSTRGVVVFIHGWSES